MITASNIVFPSSNIVIPNTNYITTDLISPFNTPIVTTLTPHTIRFTPLNGYVSVKYNPELNDSWYLQKQTNDYLFLRILDYWIHEPEMKSIRKFLTVDKNSNVHIVKSEKEYNDNDISQDTELQREAKADFLEEERIFTKDIMRNILRKITQDYGLKWQHLAQKNEEKLVLDLSKKYIKKALKDKMK